MYDESEPVLELYPFHPCYPGFFGINCHLQCHCHPSCYCSPVEGWSSCDEIQGCHLLYTDFPFCQGILVPNWRNLMTTFGTPEQKWANNRAADKNVFLRCLQRLNFVFRVIILALLVSYKSYAALCNNSQRCVKPIFKHCDFRVAAAVFLEMVVGSFLLRCQSKKWANIWCIQFQFQIHCTILI